MAIENQSEKELLVLAKKMQKEKLETLKFKNLGVLVLKKSKVFQKKQTDKIIILGEVIQNNIEYVLFAS